MKNVLYFMLASLLSFCGTICATTNTDASVNGKTTIVGGGVVGALESYYAYKDAQKSGKKICITIYDKGDSCFPSKEGRFSTSASYNIAPSLTPDEILSVIPRGSELVEKLTLLFNQPGGIRVDDVPGANDSEAAIKFKEAVAIYSSDKDHDDRTQSLKMLGKRSMDLWQQLYDEGDAEFKAILEASNFNPCREPKNTSRKVLHDGYRVDLIYGIPNAVGRALNMKEDYNSLGYQQCAVLSPDEVVAIDPYLVDFCQAHSELDAKGNRVWKNDSAAIWRPGGCIDGRTFLPKFYAYMKKVMGQYRDSNHQIQDCFQIHFNSEVIGVEYDPYSADLRIIGLRFSNGQEVIERESGIDYKYVFCPGESIGVLQNLGFNEPAYSAFAGPSLYITVPLSQEQVKMYQDFSHCMEVHKEGIVLAWQARFKDNAIYITVAGTKAFYGDKQPNKNEEFAKDRNLVQLNMINNVLPEFISLAYGYDTKGKILNAEDLTTLEEKGFARRWVGRRSVAYDGYPTLGALYHQERKVSNARCTTHLGSGGFSFGPGAVFMSRSSEQGHNDVFVQKILKYADSRRVAK